MVIIGLNAYHGDSAACVVRDGQLIAAAEEERFRRIKHWAGFPSESIKYCLREAGVSLASVDHIAVNQDRRANLWRKVAYTLRHRPDASLVVDRIRVKHKRAKLKDELALNVGVDFRGTVHEVEHHLAHLASAFFVSPFEEAALVSVDGFGDFASAAWGTGTATQISMDAKVFFPHSLGIFYQALTQYLGFPSYGDEYKVMGLAPYGDLKHMHAMRQIVHLNDDGTFALDLDFFRHHNEKINYQWADGEPHIGDLFSRGLEDLLGPARKKDDELTQTHRDIARCAQAMYEEALFHLLNCVYAKHPIDNLALAGGCAMNSVANGKVYKHTRFKELYIQAAAGDAGGAIGAAYAVWHQIHGAANTRFVMDHAYWGPAFDRTCVAALLIEKQRELQESRCTVNEVQDLEALCARTARAIRDGAVVGWFQGRMEWGPRALGNRSILADPRRTDIRDILNSKIKRRESFRPFAPSILRDHVDEWFETNDDVPFMMQVFQVREHKRRAIAAVTHLDGSARLHTVERAANPRFYKLIENFLELTGVPVLLNTSFNENEPIVCHPAEALDCFLRTRMDVLVIGDFVISRDA